MIVRQCVQCGYQDTRRQWASLDDAAKDGAADAAWACPNCAWPEADLVEARIKRDATTENVIDPYTPVDPVEAKRSVTTVGSDRLH